MKKIITSSEILFEVRDVFGKKIRTTQNYWNKIKEEKHTELIYGISEVIETLIKPDIVLKSLVDSTIVIFRKKIKENETLVVAAKHIDGEGFLVTVYQTKKEIKKGEVLWIAK